MCRSTVALQRMPWQTDHLATCTLFWEKLLLVTSLSVLLAGVWGDPALPKGAYLRNGSEVASATAALGTESTSD